MSKDRITLNVLADITRKVKNVNVKNEDMNMVKTSKPYTNKQITLQNQLYTNNQINPNQSSDKALVLFTGSDINLAQKLEAISELKNQRVKISLVFSKMAEKILNVDKIKEKLKPEEIYLEDDILQLKKIALDYNYIVSPNITINTMSKITKGFIDEFIPNLIWTFLYMDKNVYIDFESTLNYLGLDCKNPKVEKVILEQINAIKNMGASEIVSNKYMDTIYKNRNYSQAISSPNNVINSSVEKKVYMKDDIDNSLVNGDTLILQRGSILTPLAKDKARSMGINIKFE